MSAPRVSVLLPTRNGAVLLERCVRSVLSQERDDFQLVVSDNASEDGTREILAGFAGDPRLTLLRQNEPLGVTDNWNEALAAATGDRITLIGDDDLFLPGYFDRLDALLEREGDPDVLLFTGYGYAFPGFSGSPHSHWADPYYDVAEQFPSHGAIPERELRATVEAMFRFQFPLPLNMQSTVVHRRAIDLLSAGLFKPPFPDFYGLNALMLRTPRWAISDERLVVVGVSPKSFGRTVNSSESTAEGASYLGIDSSFRGQLPGSEIVNGTVKTLLALKADYPGELRGVTIDRAEYVTQQVYSWYVQRRLGSLDTAEVLRRLRALSRRDWVLLVGMVAARARPAALKARLGIDRDDPAPQLWPGMQPLPEVGDIGEFAAWVEERRPAFRA